MQPAPRFEVILAGKRLACIVHGGARRLECGTEGGFAGTWVAGWLVWKPRRCYGDGGGDLGEHPFGLAPDGRLLAGGELGGRLRSFAAVERLAEREAIVALCDGLFGTFQSLDGGTVVFGGIRVRAGGSRRIDGALRLMQFPARRFAAGRDEEGDGKAQAGGGTARHRA